MHDFKETLMHAYTHEAGQVKAGLRVQVHERYGPSVTFGEQGQNGKCVWLAMHRRYPAQIRDGHVYEATVEIIKVGERTFPVLCYSLGERDEILVRINTRCATARVPSDAADARMSDVWTTVVGSPQIIVEAWGSSGHKSNWLDVLLSMSIGDVVCINSGVQLECKRNGVLSVTRGPHNETMRQLNELFIPALESQTK